ncbi:MAG TPA: hypothetical protein PLF96_03410 [Thermotogota bacterium]|nr:hypothetical protein [Thermotogota bacterium]
MRWKSLVCLAACFLCVSVSARTFSEDFIGLILEVKPDFFLLPEVDKKRDIVDLSFNAVYGPSWFSPFRFRGGMGIMSFKKPYVSAGVEWVVFETLNESYGIQFGGYISLLGNLGLEHWDLFVEAGMMIPVSPIGGVQVAVGVNRMLHPTLSLAYRGGIYPLQVQEPSK